MTLLDQQQQQQSSTVCGLLLPDASTGLEILTGVWRAVCQPAVPLCVLLVVFSCNCRLLLARAMWVTQLRILRPGGAS
jgi:hypothetical protein